MADLTARQIAALAAPGWHRIARNLYLRIGPGRSYVFRAKHKGREIWRGLGPAAIVPLAMAKAKALEMRLALYSGSAPGKRGVGIVRPTFAEACSSYLDAHGERWRDPRARGQLGNRVSPLMRPSYRGCGLMK
jgi:hypothetical protein